MSVDVGWRVRTALSVLCTLVGLAACAPSGDEPRNRLETWESPSGEYRIRYLSPPWELAQEDVDYQLFRIRSNAELVGAVDGGPGKYELHVTTTAGAVPALMDAELRMAIAAGREIREGPRGIETREGINGMELLTFEPTVPIERYRRIVLLPLSAGRVLRLGFEATPDLGTREVDAMIDEVGIGEVP